MSESLDDAIKAKFEGRPDSYLIRRMEHAPDFGSDDEEYELSRRTSLAGLAWKWSQKYGRDVVEIYAPTPTDDERIDQEIARAQSAGEGISDAAARVIASQLHGGQSSAFYSLASTGYINEDELPGEIARNRREFQDNPQVLTWLDHLERYVMHRESTEAVEAWSERWLGDEE